MEIDRAVVESLFADATRCNCGAVLHATTSRIAHVYRLNGQRPGEQIRVRSRTVLGSFISSRWQLTRGGPAAMSQRSRGLGQLRPSSRMRIWPRELAALRWQCIASFRHAVLQFTPQATSECAPDHASIHTQRCAGSGRGQRAGDVSDQRRDLLRLSEALDERAGSNLLEELLLKISKRPPARLGQGVNKLAHTARFGRTWQDAVDSDGGASEGLCQAA